MTLHDACVLGVDVGTSGVRVVALNKLGNEIAMSRVSYREISLDINDASSHRSTELWWRVVRLAIKAVVENIPDHDVVAISVDGTSGSVLPIDRNGKPMALPLMYNHAVNNQDILDDIARVMPNTSAAGGATSGLAKAIEFLPLNPFAVVHQADWIVGKLTGNYTHSDANNALKTGFDPVSMTWPEWISEVANVVSLLPNVANPGDVIDKISNKVANEIGISSSAKIVAGTTDGCAAFLATCASQFGDAVTSLGSTLTLKLLSEHPIYAPEYGIYSHRIGKMWLAGGASNTGGAVLEHFFTEKELNELCIAMSTDQPTGLDLYPLIKPGERFPVNDPLFQPRMEPRPESDQLFLQALLEGIAYIESAGYEKLAEIGGPVARSIRTVGGGASNAAFSRIRQNTLQVQFETTLSEEAAFGVATLARKAADQHALW